MVGITTMNNRYLMHYGVKGMKWGVRRYQNADGTLTDAGKRKYNYGSVSVSRNKDYKEFLDLKKDGYRSVGIYEQRFRQMESDTHDEIIAALALANKTSYNKVEKSVNKNKKRQEQVNSLIDQYMDEKLSDLIKDADSRVDAYEKEYGIGRYAKSNSKAKPKYTQKQAINKVYSDLEKQNPNFNKLPQKKQDELFRKHANKTGMYKYI